VSADTSTVRGFEVTTVDKLINWARTGSLLAHWLATLFSILLRAWPAGSASA